MIKVAQVLTSLNRGGIETWLKDVVLNRDRENYQIDFVLTSDLEGAYDDTVRDAGADIHKAPMKDGLLKFSREFYRILRREKYDVVHAHPHFMCGYICLIAFLAGVPVRVSHSHNDTSAQDKQAGWGRRIYLGGQRLLMKWFSSNNIACSGVAGDALFGNMPFEVLYCGVDFSKFSGGRSMQRRKEILSQLNLPEDGFYVGHVGRFMEQKNHGFLIDIFERFATRRPDAFLLLTGDGPLMDRIREKVDAKGLKDKVFILGARDDVPALMQNVFDAFLLPSLHEGLPIVLLEAEAAGLKCLLTDNITKEGIVITENIRCLSLDQTADKWAEQLHDLVEQPGTKPGEDSARVIQSSPFSIGHSVGALQELYSRKSGGKAQ